MTDSRHTRTGEEVWFGAVNRPPDRRRRV